MADAPEHEITRILHDLRRRVYEALAADLEPWKDAILVDYALAVAEHGAAAWSDGDDPR